MSFERPDEVVTWLCLTSEMHPLRLAIVALLAAPACGSSEGGGSPNVCTAPCGPVSLAQMQASPFPLAAANGRVAWINHQAGGAEGIVKSVSTAGGSSSELATASGSPGQLWNHLVVDDRNVYWVSTAAGAARPSEIHAVPVSGGTQKTLYTDPNPIGGIENVVTAGGAVYTSSSEGVIRIDRDTGAVTKIVTTDCGATEILVDAEHVYCFGQAITMTPLAGGVSTTLVPPPTSSTYRRGFAIDDADLYFMMASSTDETYTLQKVPLSGGSPTVLAANLQVRSMSFVVNEVGVFWIAVTPSVGTYPLMRVDLAGGTPVVASPMGDGAFLAADARNVYVATFLGNINEVAF